MVSGRIIIIVMVHSYLLYIGIFGAAVVTYLWLRDARIFYRTALPGYRKSAYYGVVFTALSLTGVLFMGGGSELIGVAMILIALYVQGGIKRERDRVWSKSSTKTDRLLGKAVLQKAKPIDDDAEKKL